MDLGYEETMWTRRKDNLYGHLNTNTSHPEVELILHASISFYHDAIVSTFPDGDYRVLFTIEIIVTHAQVHFNIAPEESEGYRTFVQKWPPTRSMAALLLMIIYPSAFESHIVNNKLHDCPAAVLTMQVQSSELCKVFFSFSPSLKAAVDDLKREVEIKTEPLVDNNRTIP